MSLNTNTVDGTRPIHAEPKIVDSIYQGHPFALPLDVIPNILRHLPATKLSELSLVCKHWRILVDNDDFPNKMILPPNFNGPQRWAEYTNTDAGKAPPLKRWVFKCMEKGGHMLTFIPETVTITKDGAEWEMPINSLEMVGHLFAHTINGRTMGFGDNSWEEAIKEVRPSKKGHWVLLSKEAIGRNLDYDGQVAKATEMDATVSDLIDTVVSLFMEFFRTGERHFIWDSPKKGQKAWIRVNDQTKRHRLGLGFVPSGLYVCYLYLDSAGNNRAFALARKSLSIGL